MADTYTRSGGDTGAWTGTNATLSAAAGVDTAGNANYVASDHSESAYAASTTFAWAGTLASPSKIIVGTTAAAPPTTSGTGVIISTGNGAYMLTWSGTTYTYGLILRAGVGASSSNAHLQLGGSGVYQYFEDCSLELASTGTGARILTSISSTTAPMKCEWRDCTVKFATTGHRIMVEGGEFSWNGGSILSGSSAITTLVLTSSTTSRAAIAKLDSLDLTNGATALNIFDGGTINNSYALCVIRNSRLPASWSGDVSASAPSNPGQRYEMYNCDAGDTNYKIRIRDYAGDLSEDTAVYADDGADAGDSLSVNYSWKVVTSANAEWPIPAFYSPELMIWNNTTGSAVTVAVEIVHNSQGSGTNGCLTNAEAWLEVMHLGTSGYPQGVWASDDVRGDNSGNPLAAAADQATSSTAWTGDAAGWDTQTLSVSITPQEKGYIVARVCIAKASATVYIDPKLRIS